MKKAAFAFGILLIFAGIGSVAYSKLPEIHQEIQTTNINAYFSLKPPEDKFMFTLSDTGEKLRYVVELTAPTRVATQQQAQIMAQIQSIGASIQNQFTETVNAMTVMADGNQIMQIASLPQVKRIYEDRILQSTIGDEDSNTDTSGFTVSRGDTQYTGKGIMVFVIDTGIDSSHEALQRDGEPVVKDSFSIYSSEYTHWHGTFCAGIIHEVAPDADLGSVCVFNSQGQAYISDILQGIDYVAHWHRTHDEFCIASCSWGIEVGSYWKCGAEPCIICESVNGLSNSGIPVIVAAGNSGPEERTINCPGNAKNAITVGAIDENNLIASFSSRGPTPDGRKKPDVVAYGVNILGLNAGGGTRVASGTSFSTPMVSGVVACLAEKYGRDYTSNQYHESIIESADDLGEAGWDRDYGYGKVNIKCNVRDDTKNCLL